MERLVKEFRNRDYYINVYGIREVGRIIYDPDSFFGWFTSFNRTTGRYEEMLVQITNAVTLLKETRCIQVNFDLMFSREHINKFRGVLLEPPALTCDYWGNMRLWVDETPSGKIITIQGG